MVLNEFDQNLRKLLSEKQKSSWSRSAWTYGIDGSSEYELCSFGTIAIGLNTDL